MPDDEFLKRRSRELRRDPNRAEARVWRLLRDRRLAGLKFRRQHVIGPYIADFVCLTARLVIEIDGDSHEDPEADARRTVVLEAMGYKVIPFRNSYVYDRESHILDMILDALRDSALPSGELARLDVEGLLPTALTPTLSPGGEREIAPHPDPLP
jgi:very-short-patch-repair endonuclease